MKFLEFLIFRILVACFAITPFWKLYIMSDFIYFILYYIIKYRKAVVIKNIRNSFPAKSEEEVIILAKKFFRHLTDITLESIKSMSMSEKNLRKRYILKNIEIANNYFDAGKSILCLTSHYGNWEYGILSTNNAIFHQAIALYLPLTNKRSEKYGLKRRKRFGIQMVAVQETKSIFAKPLHKPVAIIMAADQSPSNLERSIWVDFLNQETACLHGPEAYAYKTGMPVVYLKISKIKRGYYQLEFEKLIDDPSKCVAGETTKTYFNRLERDITEKPEYWLWSHRRWKHKKTE